MWEKYFLDSTDIVSNMMTIIDDALCYGFEFKVENHELYFRYFE